MISILTAKNLVKTYTQTQGFFSRTKHTIHALDHVSINIERGTTMAVVGESGSGKSTLAKSLIKLIDIDEGVIQFNGKNMNQIGAKELKQTRKNIQMYFKILMLLLTRG